MQPFCEIHKLSNSGSDDIVLLMHGLESHSGWFYPFLDALQDLLPWTAVVYDRAGWGRSAGERGHLRSIKQCLRELGCIIEAHTQGNARLHLVGMSFGGVLALNALDSEVLRSRIATLTLLSPGIAPLWRPPLSKAMSILAGRLLLPKSTLSLPFSAEDFATDPVLQSAIVEDRLKIDEITVQTAYNVWQLIRRAKRMLRQSKRPPTALFLAERDTIVDNAAILEMTSGLDIQTKIYPDARHALVLEKPTELAQDVARWLNSPPSSALPISTSP